MIIKPEDIIAENSLAISKLIFQFTPIIAYRDKGRIVPVSSGLFLQWKEEKYLVTAGHTIKRHQDRGLGIIFHRTFLTIGGESGLTNPKEIENDRVDIGIYKLSQDFLEQLSEDCKFFNLSRVDIDHDDSTIDLSYLVVGHPLTRITFNEEKKKYQLRPFLFMTDLIKNEEKFSLTGAERKTHLLIGYDKNRIMHLPTRNSGKGPEPEGLSGCGVWRISNTIVHDPALIEYFPTGIAIEHYKEHSAIVVTRLRVVTEAMRRLFGSGVPASKRVSFKL